MHYYFILLYFYVKCICLKRYHSILKWQSFIFYVSIGCFSHVTLHFYFVSPWQRRKANPKLLCSLNPMIRQCSGWPRLASVSRYKASSADGCADDDGSRLSNSTSGPRTRRACAKGTALCSGRPNIWQWNSPSLTRFL